MEVLKRFAFNSTTSSLTERNILFRELFSFLETKKQNKNEELPEAAYKLIGRMIYYLFPIYIDKQSKLNIIKLNNYLIELNYNQSIKGILSSLEAHSKIIATNHPNRGMACLSLYGLDIISELILSVDKNQKEAINAQNEDFKKMTLVFSNFVLGSCLSLEKQNHFDLSYKKLTFILKKIPGIEVQLVKAISQLIADDAETSAHKLLFCGFLLRYYNETNSNSYNELKNSTMEFYLKHLLGSRKKPIESLVKCSNYWLKYSSRDDFKDKILGAVQRSLLRNPEIVLQTVRYLLEDLVIDLSDFSKELVAILGSQLITKDEQTQNEAARAVESLAKQCSSTEAVQLMIKHLFHIINGGEGKLSVSNQKIAILSAIGSCSLNCSQNSQDTFILLLTSFGDFLKSETHEPTLIIALQQLYKWFTNIKVSNPSGDYVKKLNTFFRTLIENKSYTPSVRTNIYQNMVPVYTTSSSLITNIESFIPSLMASIEKANAQTTQNTLVTGEALCAALILAYFLMSDLSKESKIPNFLNIICDTKKQIFTNEKFLYTLNEQGLKNYCSFFEKLVEILASKDKVDLNNYHLGYVYTLLHTNYGVRKHAQDLLKNKLFKWCSSKIVIQLYDCIEPTLNLFNPEKNPKLSTSAEASPSADTNIWPSSKGLCECVITLVTIQNLTRQELESIALKCLIFCNLPSAIKTDPNLYEKCLLRLLKENKSNINVTINRLIESQSDDFVSLVLDGESLNEKQLNSIQTLVRLDGKFFLEKAIKYALNRLNETPRLCTITRHEYEILNLKEGELYDKSLIESTLKQMQDVGNQTTNLRRENKAYSYKDQLAEMELRKELEAKKAGTKQNQIFTLEQIRAQMSKKQQELLDAQVQSENRIREEMRKLDSLVNKCTDIISRVIYGNPYVTKSHLAVIIRTLIKFVRSPLCIPYLLKLLKSIALNCYSTHSPTNHGVKYDKFQFYDSLINCFLRLSDAPIQLDSCWLDEPLKNAYTRIVNDIKSEIDSEIDLEELDLSKSSFYYPFFKFAVEQSSMDEGCFRNIIEIIFKYSNHLNRVQQDALLYLNATSSEGIEEDDDNLNELKQAANNFLRTEYVSLMIHIITVLTNRKLNVNIQYMTSEVSVDLFKFISHVLFSKTNMESILGILNFNMFLEAYDKDMFEIINGLNSSILAVRENSLKCLQILIDEKSVTSDVRANTLYLSKSTYQQLTHRLIVSCYDVEASNRELSDKLWEQGKFQTSENLCLLLIEDIVNPIENIRVSAAQALANMVKNKHIIMAKSVVENLIGKYDKLNEIIEPKKDQFGRTMPNEQPIDEWESRAGIANALANLAECVPTDDDSVLQLFTFFVNKSLNDRNQTVRNKMLEASIAGLNFHGRTKINELLPLFENFLQDTPKVASYDSVRQNVVILMGTLAKHLDKDDPKVAPIIGKLVQALQTPSQQVQEAVANCLPPLMPSIKTQVPTYVNQLLNLLLSAQTYGERRGAAYGLAGMLKGVGMLSLRQLNVLQRLNEAVNNKEDAKQREGALIAYEMLTIIFNKVFEPYSVEILPNLLLCFGDSDANVRQAADDCAKAIMANLTFTGVKMILPKLLERLGEEESWRTKCGSVELLGNMAHCAPKQLSTCLPNIVPKLIEVLSDSHIKVQKAGTQALRQIGSVIKNPEIQSITNTLLEALQDPALKTQKALQVLLETKFVHFIDAPSLALIMPVVQRAFQDRSTEIRKMAAQIMGNMYSLTDQKDLLPYLPAILPGLKLSLLDPVPEVRSVSSKALGAMIRAIGENGLNEIISWLMEKLVSETSSVDRSGAAQGLSEVFGALGVNKLEKSMPEIIERAIQIDLSPFVRDGYMMMFIYLPLTFGEDFTPYVGQIIQPILKALADDSEFVRDTAIKAGQRIVNTYAETAISLFLPELEKGLFDVNWRIRFSSVQLLGDLLYKVSGVVGKMTTESAHEDDNFGTEKGSAAIIKALGEERRNRVYSGLYMGRSDISLQVRQAALHVWKVIVSNTPRTLKEILPTLFNLLLGCLASSNHDKRQIAATTLVDIVKKLGERILPDIIPILEYGLNSERSDQRQGVCIGLTEIMASTSKDNIIAFSDSLVPTVRKALMDPLPEVRNTAARTFDNLHNMIGVKALEEVTLHLLEEMKKTSTPEEREMSERALDGLKQIMIVKSRALLPFLIPYLTQPPVNIEALCKLCCFASTDVLSRHLSKILTTLVHALAATSSSIDSSSNEVPVWVKECEVLLLSINDPDGVKTIVNELLSHVNVQNPSENQLSNKSSALDMLLWFCSKTKADYSYHVDDLIKSLLSLFAEKNEVIVVKAWNCLNSIIDSIKGASLLQRLPAIRQSIRLLTQHNQMQTNLFYEEDKVLFNDETGLKPKSLFIPGFCLPKKGISCLLPVFKEGLLNGSPDLKEQSALVLCECIKLADGDSLKSSVMAITGPLIRVLGERYSSSVKSAILDAIYFLLLKVDITLRPFLPQLQPTFLKNLNDLNRNVRIKSGCALAKLLFMNPKMDQIIIEIINYIKNAQDSQTKETLLNTLRLCVNNIGSKLQDDTKKQVFVLLNSNDYIYNQEYEIRRVSAGALGSLSSYLKDDDFNNLFDNILDYKKHEKKGWANLQAISMIIAVAIQQSAKRLVSSDNEKKILKLISDCASSDRTPVCLSTMRALFYYMDFKIKNSSKVENEVAVILAKGINHSTTEVKTLSVQMVTCLSITNKKKTLDANLLKIFIPMLVNGTREKEASVRLLSEIALIDLLNYKQSQDTYNQCLSLLDTMKESFADCVKSLSKESMNYNINIENYQIDETLVKLDSQ